MGQRAAAYMAMVATAGLGRHTGSGGGSGGRASSSFFHAGGSDETEDIIKRSEILGRVLNNTFNRVVMDNKDLLSQWDTRASRTSKDVQAPDIGHDRSFYAAVPSLRKVLTIKDKDDLPVTGFVMYFRGEAADDSSAYATHYRYCLKIGVLDEGSGLHKLSQILTDIGSEDDWGITAESIFFDKAVADPEYYLKAANTADVVAKFLALSFICKHFPPDTTTIEASRYSYWFRTPLHPTIPRRTIAYAPYGYLWWSLYGACTVDNGKRCELKTVADVRKLAAPPEAIKTLLPTLERVAAHLDSQL